MSATVKSFFGGLFGAFIGGTACLLIPIIVGYASNKLGVGDISGNVLFGGIWGLVLLLPGLVIGGVVGAVLTSGADKRDS